MKKIILIILFLSLAPSVTRSSNNGANVVAASPAMLEKITPLQPSGKLEVVNISNDDIWLDNK